MLKYATYFSVISTEKPSTLQDCFSLNFNLCLSCLQPSSIRGLVASWTSLLHFLLSLVFLNKSSNGIPVHSYMLSIHSILGFPCFLAPSVVPCMISFSRQSPFFLIMCPKYDNFLLLTMLSSPRYIPAVSNTHSFFFCVHDTLRIPLC